MNKKLRFVTLSGVLLLLLALFCGCNYWHSSPFTNPSICRRRAVWVDSGEMASFADKNIVSPFTTVELPQNYPNLRASHYYLLDLTIQEFITEKYTLNTSHYVMEFLIDGETVYGIVNLSDGYLVGDYLNEPGFRRPDDDSYKLNRTKSERIYNKEYTNIKYFENGSENNFDCFSHSVLSIYFNYNMIALLDGYKADESLDYLIKYFTNAKNHSKEWYLYSIEDATTFKERFGSVTFLDFRNIPEDEKIAWHMQVVNDVKNNSYDNYWTQQQ